MSVDYGEAAKIAGGGFGITFLILIILALVAWIVGLILQRINAKDEEENGIEKTDV